MKDSEILRKAKILIETKKTYRVCFAINDASGYSQQGDDLMDWVSEMIRPHSCYEDWLIEHHPEVAKEHGITTIDHIERLRPGRLVWLDWMIAYCEKEEAENEKSTKSSRKVGDTRQTLERTVRPGY